MFARHGQGLFLGFVMTRRRRLLHLGHLVLLLEGRGDGGRGEVIALVGVGDSCLGGGGGGSY